MSSDPTHEGDASPLVQSDAPSALERPGEPPVVARMVVEIRSDGSRTIARGAMEDHTSGEKVALEVEGATPAALLASLTRALFQAPFLARMLDRGPGIGRTVARALLAKKR